VKRRRSVKVHETLSTLLLAAPVILEETLEIWAPTLPDRIGSDLTFVEFADEIEPSMLWNIVKS
jgi:hypothetical protein